MDTERFREAESEKGAPLGLDEAREAVRSLH